MKKFIGFFIISAFCSASFAAQVFVVEKGFSIPAGENFYKLSTYKGQADAINYQIDCFFVAPSKPNTLVTEKGDQFEVTGSSNIDGIDLTPEEKIAVQIGFDNRPLNFVYPYRITIKSMATGRQYFITCISDRFPENNFMSALSQSKNFREKF